MRRLLFSVLLVSLLPLQAYAQSVSSNPVPSAPVTSITLGQSAIALTGPWKFRVGDDPQWADPNYDDSLWENMDLTPKAGSFDPTSGWSGYVPGWTAKGHPDYWGYAWYRIRVQMDVHPGEGFALAGPANVDDAYSVYANGALLGSFGKLPTDGKSPTDYYSQPMMFQLPQAQSTGPQVLLLAFRVWMEPDTLLKAPDAGGFHNAPLLGQAGAITANYELGRLTQVRTYAFAGATAALFFLLAIMAASLILFDREDPVYRWLAGVFLLTALERANACFASLTQIESIVASTVLTDVFLLPLILAGWVMVWWAWFRLRHMPWMPKVIVFFTIVYMFSNALGEDIFYNLIPHPLSAFFHLASAGVRILFLLPLVFVVIEGVNTQGWEGLLALPAVMLVVISQFQPELAVLHFRTNWFPFGAQVTLAEVACLTLAAVIFVLLIRRLLLSMERQKEIASDIKQAQEIQKVLIPEELPRLLGVAIESEYRPASEVGGDFFQIIPHPSDGSVLIVVGDVTGHGLQAGMLGALIVGAIRTEAAHSNDPLDMIVSLNAQLFERGHAHATCLAMRISVDYKATFANAGHLPPYLNGKELPIEGSLPLGMLPKADFTVMNLQLEPGDNLMLLSDGVVEAQNEEGRLFGFDRIRQMLATRATAADLASAAQTFGQQDDISVLSISCTAVPGRTVVWRTQPIA